MITLLFFNHDKTSILLILNLGFAENKKNVYEKELLVFENDIFIYEKRDQMKIDGLVMKKLKEKDKLSHKCI